MILTLQEHAGRPQQPDFAVVTATTRPTPLAESCIGSWLQHATYGWPVYQVIGVYGVVPAFAAGVAYALAAGARVVAAFHDDLRIDEDGWDARVLAHFEDHPRCGLAGFGGARGLGSPDIYRTPYSAYQLARYEFLSNMVDAEAHGQRTTRTQRAVCFDGFSQIGRAEFFGPAWQKLMKLGLKHHFYDGALGCEAALQGWEAWLIPVACTHFGGQTAVGDAAYNEWAATQITGGDAGFWEESHRIGYHEFVDVLPLRLP